MSIYLGVDVGADTGLAAIDDIHVCRRREVVSLIGTYAQRLHELDWELRNFLSGWTQPLEMLVVEEPPRVKSTTVYKQLCGYHAIVLKVCADLDVPCESVNNLTIKKTIVRGGAVGKSTKEDMMFKAASLIGETVPEFKTKKERDFAQNGYDAVLCAFYARFLMEGK